VTERVPSERVPRVAAMLGTVPMLLTVDDDGRPRAAVARDVALQDPVSGAAAGRTMTLRAGRRSSANARRRPLVGLLWPAPPGGRAALLVDGEVIAVEAAPEQEARRAEGAVVTLRVASAVLHAVTRTGGAPTG
jgi:hypothetical protein